MATPKPPKTPTGRGGASGGATGGATGGGGGANSSVEGVENVPSTTVKVKNAWTASV